MANITITPNDLNSPILEGAEFRDDSLYFSGADTYVAGTILARKAVADAIVVAADAGNTGDGTVTAAAVVAGPIVPLVGAYVLTCTAATTNGGTFKLEDPNGALIAQNLVITAGAGVATAFTVGGMTFTITDGTTDFVAGDIWTLTVAADGRLVAFVKGTGIGGAQIPSAILTYAVTATTAGAIPIRAAVEGYYRKEKLVIDADGDDTNVDAAVIDQLRVYGLTPINVDELNIADNS